jgi:hypothetical protein
MNACAFAQRGISKLGEDDTSAPLSFAEPSEPPTEIVISRLRPRANVSTRWPRSAKPISQPIGVPQKLAHETLMEQESRNVRRSHS